MASTALRRQALREEPEGTFTLRLPYHGPSSSVDAVFHLPFVPSGYRHVGCASECVLSSLTWCNETLNIWTHALPALVFLYWLVMLVSEAWSWESTLYVQDAYVPLILQQVGCISAMGFSTVAHTFHSLTPWHHQALYILDYGGIGLYSLTSAVAHYSYSRPSQADVGSAFATLYILAAFSIHLWVFVTIVIVRLAMLQSPVRVHILIACYGTSYVINFLPFLARRFTYGERLPSDPDHWAQFGCCMLSGALMALHVPERLSPRLFGKTHSHSIMHVLVALGFVCQRRALRADLVATTSGFSAAAGQPPVGLLVVVTATFALLCIGVGVLIARRIDGRGKLNTALFLKHWNWKKGWKSRT